MSEFIVGFLLVAWVAYGVYTLARRIIDPVYAARKDREHVKRQRDTIRNADYERARDYRRK